MVGAFRLGYGRCAVAYDAQGQRLRAMYSLAGKVVHEERRGKGASEYIHIGGRLLVTRSPTGATWAHVDALRSPVAVTDGTGSVVERRRFEPYGAELGGLVKDGPGYTGHVSDSATGLTYMQQRYMDPLLGVFLSVDPVTAYEQPVGQFNRYRYANGNPYKFTDPDGRQSSGNVNPRSTGVPFFDWLMSPSDGRGSTGKMVEKQLASELSQPHSAEDVVLYTAIAMSAGIGAGSGAGARAIISVEGRVAATTEVAEMSGMLRDAARGKGNFGIGSATSEQADVMGRAWVGSGSRKNSSGNALISRDGPRQYRFPSEKANSHHAPTGIQANFESRSMPEGRWTNNAHLNVEKKMTKARLKGIDAADWDAAFERYQRTGLFDCYFQASIGADDSRGADLFGFTACNHEWLGSMIEDGRSIPKFVVVNDVSLEAVERAVELVCGAVPDGRWEEVAHKLAELMDWEFEGYVPRRR